jgi:hypothetical protein
MVSRISRTNSNTPVDKQRIENSNAPRSAVRRGTKNMASSSGCAITKRARKGVEGDDDEEDEEEDLRPGQRPKRRVPKKSDAATRATRAARPPATGPIVVIVVLGDGEEMKSECVDVLFGLSEHVKNRFSDCAFVAHFPLHFGTFYRS